jgi:superfamily II DNA or RNA helicase
MNVREKIQDEATTAIRSNMYEGIAEVAPRVGKCKISIDALNLIKSPKKVLIMAPKTPIFDSWKSDIKRWGLQDKITVDYVWSNSIYKNTEHYDLIIADEIHEYNENVLKALYARRKEGTKILGLTGTLDGNSKDFIRFHLGIGPIYTYTVEQAIKDKIVADYKIYCVGVDLDDVSKNVVSGTKEKPFMQTEKQAYTYWDNQYVKAMNRQQYKSQKFLMSKRRDVIYNSHTKFLAAKYITSKVDRCIIFSGYQKIADKLGDAPYHSKSDKQSLQDFQDGKIDKLSAVSMISMGVTISDLKIAVFNQLKSGENLAVQQAMRAMNIDGDKIATIYIIYLKGTRDEIWLNSALNGFEKSKISYCSLKDLKL